jgi:hypothetical protein
MRQRPTSAFFCAALAACGPDIDEKHDEWRAKAPDTYVVGVCSHGVLGRVCSLFAVEQGLVLAAEQWRAPLGWEPIVEPTEPIEAAFSTIDETDCDLDVTFDRRFSYPRDFWLNCGEEGYGETVECFVPGNLDLEVCRNDINP